VVSFTPEAAPIEVEPAGVFDMDQYAIQRMWGLV
jgi:hypothetical protein